METESQNVVVTNVKMPFFSMVVFMIKWMLASIPALIIVGIILGALVFGISMAANMLGFGDILSQFITMPSH